MQESSHIMNVHGIAITADQQAAAIERMQKSAFSLGCIETALIKVGVPERINCGDYVANRAADRLIQRERKAGNITYKRPLWYPAPKGASGKGRDE